MKTEAIDRLINQWEGEPESATRADLSFALYKLRQDLQQVPELPVEVINSESHEEETMNTNDLKDRLECASVNHTRLIAVDAIDYAERLEEENQRLREALGVYAKKANWRRNYDGAGHLNVFIVDTNGPYIALAALEGGNP